MKWTVGSSLHGCWLGTYELDKQYALQRFLCPGMTVYDIGAQAGFYTLFFSALVGESGQVFAFEPCPYEAHFLIDHVKMNRLANVQVLQAAVGERHGLVGMTIDRGVTQNQVCDSSDAILMVPALMLDSLGLPPPNLIKIDVEGAEAAVLRGAGKTLRKAHPVVFVALHSHEQRALCLAILSKAHYRCYDLRGQPVDGSSLDEIYALPLA